MTFLQWLHTQTGRADLVGDFAFDAVADKGDKPRGGGVRLSDWDNYMCSYGSSDAERVVLRVAWRDYHHSLQEAQAQEYLMGLKTGTRIGKAVHFALVNGGVQGAHHKQWIIDQMIRILSGIDYDQCIEVFDSLNESNWKEGTPP